jgi:predicted MFS family arabinose efflux permease
MLAVWFSSRFGVSLASLGLLFFGVNLLAALSFVAAPRLARRFGLLKTMIAPHFVSNLFLLSVPFMPTFPLAAAFLLLRQSLSKLDVPARQAYTMALVSPEERTAAASYTTVARSIAVSASPPVAGLMLSGPMFVLGLPILLASCIGIGYDATLWRVFRHVPLHLPHRRGGIS